MLSRYSSIIPVKTIQTKTNDISKKNRSNDHENSIFLKLVVWDFVLKADENLYILEQNIFGLAYTFEFLSRDFPASN